MNAITTFKPDHKKILAMIRANPRLQPSTKDKYCRALSGYLATGGSLADPAALAAYAARQPKSGRAFLKAAIKLWGDHVALQAKAGATPENAAAVQATIYRIEALNEAIQVESGKGQKAHTWLSQSEVRRLLDTCDRDTIQGKRDRLLLGLLVGAGLRREEAAKLAFEDVITLPLAGKFRTALNVIGKGAKTRTVPLSDRLAAALDEWGAILDNAGNIARSVSKGGVIGDSLSGVGVFEIVSRAGKAMDKPDLAPHDLRRTYAQLGYEAGVSIVQISRLLGHANVATTQRYLNLDLDLSNTVSDFIPF